MSTSYQETVKLPSGAEIYPDELNVPKELTINAMTTKEEKYLYSSGANRSKALLNLLTACIEDDFDPANLISGDIDYLLTRFRVLSFGDEYHVTGICPMCNHVHEYKVSLNDLEVEPFDAEKYEKYTKFTTSKGDELVIKMLTQKELLNISEGVDKIIARSKEANRELLLDQHIRASQLLSVNGETQSKEEALKYFEKQIMKDTSKFDYYVNKANESIATLKPFNILCQKCGERFQVSFYTTDEFLHPRFD